MYPRALWICVRLQVFWVLLAVKFYKHRVEVHTNGSWKIRGSQGMLRVGAWGLMILRWKASIL